MVALDEIETRLSEILEDIQKALFEKAKSV